MSAGKIHITPTLAKVEDLVQKDRSMSPAVRGMIELLVTIIPLLVAKLGLKRSEETVNGLAEPPCGRH